LIAPKEDPTRIISRFDCWTNAEVAQPSDLVVRHLGTIAKRLRRWHKIMTDTTAEGEEHVLWDGSVSHWHYAGKWLFIILLLTGLVATFFVAVSDDQTVQWIVRGALALVVFAILIWIKLDRSRRKYLVTNTRVSVEYGIVSKSSNEMRIQDIRSINLTTKGLSGMLGIGRLEFSSAATDDADVIFWNTPSAEKIRDMVRSLQT
jgi:membrane protein YdbS with pleckstrin-like domain